MLLIVATQTLYCASCVDVGNLMIAMVSGVVAGERSQRQAKSVFDSHESRARNEELHGTATTSQVATTFVDLLL